MTVYNGNGKFDRPGPFLLSGLINSFFGSNYSHIEVYYDSPIPVDDAAIPRNTSLMSYFPIGAPQTDMNVFYNRGALSDLLGDQDLTFPNNGTIGHTRDLLVAINARFGLSLSSIDVVNEPITVTGSYPQTVTLNMTDWSYVYLPGTLDVQIVAPTATATFNAVLDPLFVKANGRSVLDDDVDVGHYVRVERERVIMAARARTVGQAVPSAPAGAYVLPYRNAEVDWSVEFMHYFITPTLLNGTEDHQPLVKITRAGAPGEEVQLQWFQSLDTDGNYVGHISLLGSSTPIVSIEANILFSNMDQLSYMHSRLSGTQIATLFPAVPVNDAGAPLDTFTFHLQLYRWLGDTYTADETFTVSFEAAP